MFFCDLKMGGKESKNRSAYYIVLASKAQLHQRVGWKGCIAMHGVYICMYVCIHRTFTGK